MFNTFYNWISYNPHNISITSVIPQIILAHVILALVLCLFVSIFQRITVKTVILSLFYTPYLVLGLLWKMYFYKETILIGFIPVYPLIIFMGVKYTIKYIKNKKVN